MSLIIEALKRARDDSVRRQAAARGLPLAPVPRLNGRSPWLTIALVPLAAALVICILLLVDLYSRLPQNTVASSANPASLTQSPLQPDPDPATGMSTSEAMPETAASDRPGTDSVASSAPALAPDNPQPSSPSHKTTEEQSLVAQPAVSGLRDTTDSRVENRPDERTAPDVPGSRVFFGQAELRNGQIIDLGGIAWSESDPYALLNGQVVGVGELIRTYRVIEITQTQVVLEQNGDRVVVRLK